MATADNASDNDNDAAPAEVDVLIVGAGPTGLALAAQLARYGIRFRIIDRNLDRAQESRALAIQPRTLEVLAPLGVAGEMVERGNSAVSLRMHVGARVVPIRLFDIGVTDTAYPFLLFLSQAETERILAGCLDGHGRRIERGVELVSMTQAGGGVDAVLRHLDGPDEAVRARYVVGCDGAHSTVRRQSGIEFTGSAYPQTFVLADLEADGLEAGAAHVFLSGAGMLFFFPLGRPATWRVLAMRPRTDSTPVDRPVSLDEVQGLTDAFGAAQVRLRDPVWMTNFRLHNRGATRYRRGRVFLAGDAAHIHSPAGAQGMNTGIQDAANLGWKLALCLAGAAPSSVLDSYEPERAPVGRLVRGFTDRAFLVATSSHPLVRFMRTRVAPRVMPLALGFTAGRRAAFRVISQLGIGYRGSELAVTGPRARRSTGGSAARWAPRAGDRLPDAELLRSGRPATLHGLINAPGWHLLLCGPGWDHGPGRGLARGRPVTVHRLTPAGTGRRTTTMPGPPLDPGVAAQLLVRPDGHVGYRETGTDVGGLRDYLDRWVPRRDQSDAG